MTGKAASISREPFDEVSLDLDRHDGRPDGIAAFAAQQDDLGECSIVCAVRDRARLSTSDALAATSTAPGGRQAWSRTRLPVTAAAEVTVDNAPLSLVTPQVVPLVLTCWQQPRPATLRRHCDAFVSQDSHPMHRNCHTAGVGLPRQRGR
jgi:hypothetical protein